MRRATSIFVTAATIMFGTERLGSLTSSPTLLSCGRLLTHPLMDEIEERFARWSGKAADKDDASALVGVGLLYYNGDGVAQDYGKAREWFEKAAEKDNALAMINLGALYANGRGVVQDYGKAREWYEKA